MKKRKYSLIALIILIIINSALGICCYLDEIYHMPIILSLWTGGAIVICIVEIGIIKEYESVL